MPFTDAKMGWVIAAVAIALGLFGGILSTSERFAQYEVRLAAVETRQAASETKLDRLLDSMARVEQELKDLVDHEEPKK